MRKNPKYYEKDVLAWFDMALEHGSYGINLYFDGINKAFHNLIERNVVKSISYRGVFIGYEYKDHLFKILAGSGDCEENLHDLGKMNFTIT